MPRTVIFMTFLSLSSRTFVRVLPLECSSRLVYMYFEMANLHIRSHDTFSTIKSHPHTTQNDA